MFAGSCLECLTSTSDGAVSPLGDYYCKQCWEYDEMRNTRCFSFAAVYDANNKLLSVGGSQLGTGCAERIAMWKLELDDDSPKTVVVSRIRRNRHGSFTFGTSKPCEQCIHTMPFYNIMRVCYSQLDDKFIWEDVCTLSNTYKSCSNVIIKL
jgi:hypothetical protein